MTEVVAVNGEVVLDGMSSLAEAEAVIEREMGSFVRVGQALAKVKAEKFYADAGFDTFEDYVKERWGLSIRYAQDQMSSARACAIARAHDLPIPPSEYAARPLAKLLNEAGSYDRRTQELQDPARGEAAVVAAWKEVVERHDPGPDTEKPKPITQKDVSKVAFPPANNNWKPSWHELIGQVGDDLILAAKHLDKTEEAIHREPNQKFKDKAAKYAAWAQDLADRLHRIEAGDVQRDEATAA